MLVRRYDNDAAVIVPMTVSTTSAEIIALPRSPSTGDDLLNPCTSSLPLRTRIADQPVGQVPPSYLPVVASYV